MMPVSRILLTVMALAGIVTAVYFTGAYYGWLRPSLRLIPATLCSPKVGGCLDILSSFYARVLGVPNSLLGLLYYAGLLLIPTGAIGSLAITLRPAILAVSWLVVAFSLFLAWSLIFRLKTVCVLCFFSHLLNLAIAILLTAGWRG